MIIWKGPDYCFETHRLTFSFLTICWLCATGCESRRLTLSAHINILKWLGIVLTYSVPSWKTNVLGREHMLWWGKQESVLFSPLDLLSTPQQNTEICSPVPASAAAVTIPSFYQKHLESLNSYSVRILKHRDQSFYMHTRPDSYNFAFGEYFLFNFGNL